MPDSQLCPQTSDVSLLRCRLFLVSLFLILALTVPMEQVSAQSGCCTVRGNTDCSQDGNIDISDLTRLIDYMFISFEPLCCSEAGNTDASIDGNIDISDLTVMIDHLFIGFNPMEPCGGGLSSGQREAVFTSIDSAYDALFGLPADSLARALAAYLAGRPELEAAGVVDSVSVWARFTDGRMISIPNNRFPDETLSVQESFPDKPPKVSIPHALPPILPRARTDRSNGGTELNSQFSEVPVFELPHSVAAFTMSTLGSQCFTSGAGSAGSLLWFGGYRTSALIQPQVADVASVRDAGVFYIDSHGGVCIARDGQPLTGIWTQTPYSNAGDSVFKNNLDLGELVYMYANGELNGKCVDQWRYAFTGKFVAKYMTFAKHSYVYIAACNSDAPSLRNGFKSAGASVYVGWTMPVTDPAANKAGLFLINRMLGDQSVAVGQAPPPQAEPWENPPQRPFDITLLKQDMHNRNIDWDPKNGSELAITKLQDDFSLLAPSIRYMTMPANTDSFLLTGYFGSNPGPKGHVRVNGIERSIYTWEPTAITVQLPKFGPGSVGPVQVEVEPLVGSNGTLKRLSNIVNLTEWKGQFTYTHKDTGSLVGTIVVNAHLRSDIHPFRELPHVPPIRYSIIFPAMEDSYATATAAGTASYTDDSDPPSTTTWTWTGSTLIDSIKNQTELSLMIIGFVDFAAHKFRMDLLAANTDPLLESIDYSDGGHDEQGLYFQTVLELYDQFPWKLILDMNNNWGIVAGERNAVTCCSHNPLNTEGTPDIKHKLIWQTIPATWAPDTTSAQ